MKVLVVDDSNVIRQRITRVIKEGALSEATIVGRARDGEEALKLCALTHPDLITMDLTMPNMDGIECIAQIAKHYPEIQILVVSALTDKGTCIKALRNGAHGFLNKPFSDSELGAALKELTQ